jgi:hypothetical protein
MSKSKFRLKRLFTIPANWIIAGNGRIDYVIELFWEVTVNHRFEMVTVLKAVIIEIIIDRSLFLSRNDDVILCRKHVVSLC